jgi:hypothetical protein
VALALAKSAICASSPLESVRQCVGKDEWTAAVAIIRGIRVWDYTLGGFSGIRQGRRASIPRVKS